MYINTFYRHFTEEGICWARNSDVKEVDDTAMAFRLLRLHGYQDIVSHQVKSQTDHIYACPDS